MNDSYPPQNTPNGYNPVYPPQPQPNQAYPAATPQGYPAQPVGYQAPGSQGYAPQNQYPAQGSIPGYQQPGFNAHDKKIPDRKSVASKSIELVYVLLIVLESLMAMRFIFKLLGADRLNPFIQFLYSITELFVGPFSSIFRYSIQNRTGVNGFEAEWTVLVAMGVYAIVAFLIVKLIDLFR